MAESDTQYLQEAHAVWLASRDCIAKFFYDMSPAFRNKDSHFPDITIGERNAAAILARLVSLERPILTVFADDYDKQTAQE